MFLLLRRKKKKTCQLLTPTTTRTSEVIHTHKYNETTKSRWPGSWHSALSHLYLDHIFMYFYFLRKSNRRFPKRCAWCEFHRAMASSRIEDVPSQSFMDGANRSHRHEEVETGALWEIQRSTEKNKTNRQWSTFISWAAPQLSLGVFLLPLNEFSVIVGHTVFNQRGEIRGSQHL